MNTLTINRLPSRTWNFLRVNETALSWDEAQTADLGAETLSLSARRSPSASPSRARAHTAARKSPSRRSPAAA